MCHRRRRAEAAVAQGWVGGIVATVMAGAAGRQPHYGYGSGGGVGGRAGRDCDGGAAAEENFSEFLRALLPGREPPVTSSAVKRAPRGQVHRGHQRGQRRRCMLNMDMCVAWGGRAGAWPRDRQSRGTISRTHTILVSNAHFYRLSRHDLHFSVFSKCTFTGGENALSRIMFKRCTCTYAQAASQP
jgi:hypothetical protein